MKNPLEIKALNKQKLDTLPIISYSYKMIFKEMDKKDTFIFNGFLPNSSLQEKCKAFYHMVEERSPNSSAKEASITKIGNNYEAKLKIISGSCNLEISSKETKPSQTIEELHKKFLNQIVDWNKHRDLFF